MQFSKLILSSLLIFMQFIASAQIVSYYPAELMPSLPYGGEAEIKRMVKQEMVYPDYALANNIEGVVFIKFEIDSRGVLLYKEIVDNGNELLGREAEFLFDKILWAKNPNKSDEVVQLEEMKFTFSIKKYNKLVKKRGYDKLPTSRYEPSLDPKIYSINEVDKKPELLSYESMNEFISKNFKYPPIAQQRGISGTVIAEFIIEPNGYPTNIRIIQALAGGCNEEMKRLVLLMKWEPSTIDEKAVRTRYEYQLTFRHPGGTVR